MSQTQTPSDQLRQQRRELLLDLAKQAESRKLQVRKMLADCADERDKETERQRGARREALQKISTDVREIRESSVRPAAPEPSAPVAKDPVPVVPSMIAKAVPSSIAALPLASNSLPKELQPPRSIASEAALIVPSNQGIPVRTPTKVTDSDLGLNPASGKVNVESAFENRMNGLEESFTKLVETVTEKLDYSSRILHVESMCKSLELQCKGLKQSMDEVSSRLQPVENKYDVLRTDHRSLELGIDR